VLTNAHGYCVQIRQEIAVTTRLVVIVCEGFERD
jgi:hypothetical protein